MGDFRCACGGPVADHKQRDRRSTGEYVVLLLRCERCRQTYQLHHFEQLRVCGRCARGNLVRSVPLPTRRDPAGRNLVHYECGDCGFQADQKERAPVAFRV